MFRAPDDPRAPPPTPRRGPSPARREEDLLLTLILVALVAFTLAPAPFCGATLWDAFAAR